MTISILNVDNVKGTRMALPMHDSTHTSGVTASSHHAEITGLELDVIHDLVGADVQPDGVVGLDDGVGVPDGAAIGGVQVGHILGAGLDLADTAQLVLSFLVGNP